MELTTPTCWDRMLVDTISRYHQRLADNRPTAFALMSLEAFARREEGMLELTEILSSMYDQDQVKFVGSNSVDSWRIHNLYLEIDNKVR